mgnify:CR=1 FL=1
MRSITLLLLILTMGGVFAVETITLIARPEGGWRTVGLPYIARISALGHLESLIVDELEFLAPSDGPIHGLFIANGNAPAAFTSIKATNDTLIIGNDGAEAELHFAKDGIHVIARNLKYTDGYCLRLEVTKNLARIKSPVTGLEHELPVKGNVSAKMRLIAYNGASLTLPGDFLYAGGKGYMVKLPWMLQEGPEAN